MKKASARSIPIIFATACTVAISHSASAQTIALDSLEGLRTHKVTAEVVEHNGRNAIHVSDAGALEGNHEDRLVVIDGLQFQDGVIEIDLAGAPGAHAGENARGFVGVAFRVAADTSTFETIYLRPTNGRADDQLRRNHSVQYFAYPEYPWHLLREETPGMYETYVDLVPGEWTRVKLEVSGEQARLYVHDAEQPVLVVNDLKLGNSEGAIGLWIGPGTDAYFADLSVTANN